MPRKQFSATTPAAPFGADNVVPQFDADSGEPEDWQNVSFYLPRRTSGTTQSVVEIEITAAAPGAFTVAHGLGAEPALVLLQMTSDGEIWFQVARYDANNLYLEASAAGVTCIAVAMLTSDAIAVPLAPSAGGNFTVAHGLSSTPALVEVQMTSDGEIWCQATPADGVNVNLVASAGGIIGYAIVWLTLPSLVTASSGSVALAPSSPGPFQVAHGLAGVPDLVLVQMRSDGEIWLVEPRADGAYLYLDASAGGIAGVAYVWRSGGGSSSGAPTNLVEFTASAGDFTVAHGLPYTPAAVIAQMDDFGAVAFRKVGGVRWDATNVYLKGSADGLAGFLEVWK